MTCSCCICSPTPLQYIFTSYFSSHPISKAPATSFPTSIALLSIRWPDNVSFLDTKLSPAWKSSVTRFSGKLWNWDQHQQMVAPTGCTKGGSTAATGTGAQASGTDAPTSGTGAPTHCTMCWYCSIMTQYLLWLSIRYWEICYDSVILLSNIK